MKRFVYSLLALTVAFTSCKKDKEKATSLDLYRDTVYNYAKDVYLWYDAIPGSFNPRSYSGSSDMDALQNEVNAISQFKINTSTNLPYEYNANARGEAKYSYIDDGGVANAINGNGGDYGLGLSYIASDDLRVRYVYPGSSAASQQLVRGYRVIAVNDQSVAQTVGGDNDPAFVRINQALSTGTVNLTLQKPDKTTFTATITASAYTINPVLKYTIVTTEGGKKVGYFAFGRFTSIDNAKNKINEAFNYFTSQGITELVVDLRYNGGGAVETSEYLANLIVPPSKSGTVMYTETYNDRMQSDNIPFLKKKYDIEPGTFNLTNNTYKFAKVGSLNLSRVFFLVTGSTASASELLINNLKPHMDVQLIGRKSYGKPVGFFDLPVGPYDLYLAMFESRNSDNKADFYQGMEPGSANFPGKLVADDVTKDFGDPTEAYFANALNYIDKGSYPATSVKTSSLASGTANHIDEANNKLDSRDFKGLVDNRLLRKAKN